MTSLACSIADGVLADTILIYLRPPLPSTFTVHQYKEGKGSTKKVRKLITENVY